jgi:hypothetical protein
MRSFQRVCLLLMPILAQSFTFTDSIRTRRRSPLSILAAIKNKKIELPPCEFSRTIQPDRILKIKRDYVADIQANEAERSALAGRFGLKSMDRLEASLKLRSCGNYRTTTTNSVEVEGTVLATVTQTCVRSNEDFIVDVEFPLYCIVHPAVPWNFMQQEEDEPDKKSKKKQNGYRPQGKVNEMDIMELQRLLQEDVDTDEDVLMEDEAIYAVTGLLDMGELVSQLFFLQLDPYPKKPGSGPVQTSITG